MRQALDRIKQICSRINLGRRVPPPHESSLWRSAGILPALDFRTRKAGKMPALRPVQGFTARIGIRRILTPALSLRVCLKMWRQASLPAVEGGILPPVKIVHLSKRSHFIITFPMATQFRRAGSPGSTSAKMADATIFRQALREKRFQFFGKTKAASCSWASWILRK